MALGSAEQCVPSGGETTKNGEQRRQRCPRRKRTLSRASTTRSTRARRVRCAARTKSARRCESAWCDTPPLNSLSRWRRKKEYPFTDSATTTGWFRVAASSHESKKNNTMCITSHINDQSHNSLHGHTLEKKNQTPTYFLRLKISVVVLPQI